MNGQFETEEEMHIMGEKLERQARNKILKNPYRSKLYHSFLSNPPPDRKTATAIHSAFQLGYLGKRPHRAPTDSMTHVVWFAGKDYRRAEEMSLTIRGEGEEK